MLAAELSRGETGFCCRGRQTLINLCKTNGDYCSILFYKGKDPRCNFDLASPLELRADLKDSGMVDDTALGLHSVSSGTAMGKDRSICACELLGSVVVK